MTHLSPKRNMAPKAVLMKFGLVSVNTARQVNTAYTKATVNGASPMSNPSKTSHSIDKNVNVVRPKAVDNAARPKAVINAVNGNNVQVCDGLGPQKKPIFLSNMQGNLQMDLQDQGVIDSGCSRHMTGNMSYLTDYEEIDGGYVAFGGNPKGRKIICRATKDETSGILKSFITRVENLIDQRLKVISCDNVTGFKNKEMNQFSERKYIKREFSVAKTPQQNRVDGRKNRTLIEAARTMLADSNLPTTFWAEAVNTACYVQNRVLVTKSHNKTPYELFFGRKLDLGFMRPFRCLVTILNTIDHLGKFDGKANEGFFVGYSINSKAFRVFNSRTRIVEENLHVHKDFQKLLVCLLLITSRTQEGNQSIEGSKIEAIRLFLAYALFKDFLVYQMDVKSAFLYGKIEEEVYVYQPPGFEDPDFPDRVYKVEMALYRLHQASRAWYETMSTYLLDNGFQRGKINNTLFIRRDKGDILLVQVYVDDIIFGSTKRSLCTEFEKMMHKKFQKSSMGELTFFLGLQVKQKEDGIFISQNKYVTKILKKFGFTDVKTASTPMETQKLLLKDEDGEGEEVDVHMYRVHTKYWVFGITKDSPFDVVAYIDSELCGSKLGYIVYNMRWSFLRSRLNIITMARNGLWFLVASPLTTEEAGIMGAPSSLPLWTSALDSESIYLIYLCMLQALVDGKKIIVTEASVRRDLQLNDEEGTDCLPNATIFEKLTRIGAKTTAWNEFSSIMASTIICLATNQKFNFLKYILESMVNNLENVSDNVTDEAVYEEMDESLEKAATTATNLDAEQDRGNINKTQSNATLNEPSSLGTSSGFNTPQSDEDSLKLKELMELCTNLQNKVGLSRRVESSDEEGLGKEDASKQGRIADIDADAGINLVSTHFDAHTDMFGVHDLVGDEVVVETEVASKDDKGKGKMVEPEPVKKLSKKDQLMLDEELAFKLQAEEEEDEERLARVKAQ
ncbi:putative ribonuclease H-like domain-containing protein [Tanacetum coccineum]